MRRGAIVFHRIPPHLSADVASCLRARTSVVLALYYLPHMPTPCAGQLRQRLADLERDAKMGRVPSGQYESLASELLAALKKLGDTLTPQELQFLNDHSSQSLKDFQKADTNLGTPLTACLLSRHAYDAAGQVRMLRRRC